MMRNPNEIEQAVARTLRDSLERLQRTTEEVNQAINDLVSACASTRPSNSLPPMLRAQTSAASLCASLEVLSRFVTAALQPPLHSPSEQHVVIGHAPSSVQTPEPPPVRETPPEMSQQSWPASDVAPVISEPLMESQPIESPAQLQASDMVEEGDPVAAADFSVPEIEPFPPPHRETLSEETLADLQASNYIEEERVPSLDAAAVQPFSESVGMPPPAPDMFDLLALRQEERDLHRRADRVAKVAMQDIKMLHPDEVKLGKEHHDLCVRLREDIERAHREYDRRFHSILDHPVDYFYNRMVEILGDGNAESLGEYPYPSPVLRR